MESLSPDLDLSQRMRSLDMMKIVQSTIMAMAALFFAAMPISAHAAETVTVDTFARAETDMTLKRYVAQGAFGKILHIRLPTPIDKQDIIRMNRDTLYSLGVFDVTSPLTVEKPDSGNRFMSMLVINQDHSMLPVEHGPGKFTFTKENIGTRYVFIIFRTFVNANSKEEIAAANALQDLIKVSQKDAGRFEIPDWDEASLKTVRDAILVLALTRTDTSPYFGKKEDLNPLYHLLGTAAGWGGNPKEAAAYIINVPKQNDGKTPHRVTVKDVPVDGFWSITVYDAKGFMQKNDMNAYSYNNVSAKSNADGSFTINFGDCESGKINCLPITKGWNYVVRQYRPRQEIIDGTWVFPDVKPVN